MRQIIKSSSVTTPKAAKVAELREVCNALIVSGVEVETSQGAEHFALDTEDQINLQNLSLQIAAGAQTVLYHADGSLCRPFSSGEVSAIVAAATAHIVGHTTRYNHLKAWVDRTEGAAELAAINYASELPADLAEHMSAILGGGA
jgi:hypothetical protein